MNDAKDTRKFRRHNTEFLKNLSVLRNSSRKSRKSANNVNGNEERETMTRYLKKVD